MRFLVSRFFFFLMCLHRQVRHGRVRKFLRLVSPLHLTRAETTSATQTRTARLVPSAATRVVPENASFQTHVRKWSVLPSSVSILEFLLAFVLCRVVWSFAVYALALSVGCV